MPRGASWFCSFAAAAVLLAAGSEVPADGGLVRVSEPSGPFRVTLFTSPTPMRAGPVDVSVMVQDRETGRPVLDARVALEWVAVRGDRRLRIEATRDQAMNKLLYAALPELPLAGAWELQARVSRASERGEVSCRIDVLPPLPPLVSFWPYLALPPLGVVLFAANRRLVKKRIRSRAEAR